MCTHRDQPKRDRDGDLGELAEQLDLEERDRHAVIGWVIKSDLQQVCDLSRYERETGTEGEEEYCRRIYHQIKRDKFYVLT